MTILAGTVSIIALKRFQDNFDSLINTNLPALTDTAHISQLSGTVADRGPSLVISPNTWARLTIIGQVEDDANWLEEILNRIPDNELTKFRKAKLLELKTTLVKTYNILNALTEERIRHADRLIEIQQQMFQIQKDLVSAQSYIDLVSSNALASRPMRKWHEAIHSIIFKLMEGLTIKHPIPLQLLKTEVDINIDQVFDQISKLPIKTQRNAAARLAKLNAVALGENGLFNVKNQDLKATAQVLATLSMTRNLAERFMVATELVTRDVQKSIDITNQETSKSMDAILKALIGFIFISAFIVVMTYLYVNRTIIRRLSNLRGSMLTHAEGAVEKIDTSGTDEITDMAQSLQYLVDALHSREIGLMEAKEEAESASIAKTRFLAAASHDLRQPLQALNLFIYALENQEDDPAKREIIKLIRNSLDSLKELLNTLLDVSKLEAGVIHPVPRSFPAGDVIESIRNEMTAVAWAKDIKLHVVSSNVQIFCDPSLLGTVVRNLLDNAIKYTETGKVLVGCRKRGNAVRIEVWDTGPGIPEDQNELIFQDFYQIDNEARKRTQGLGLGLSIVKRMANLLDCSMAHRSVLGKGSVFWVEIPIAEPSLTPPKITSSFVQTIHKVSEIPARIVIFEDDEQVLLGLKSVLEGHGYITLCFQSVHHQRIKDTFSDERNRPDLIVADYRLESQITGREAIALVQGTLGEAIPAIIITGDTAPERLREAKTSGFPILHKPISPELLLAQVQESLTTSIPKEQNKI